jgi:hypothetical protein
MSDDNPGGWIALEDGDGQSANPTPEPEAPAAPEPEPTEPVAEPEPEPPAAEDDDAEPTDVLSSGDGRKYVPLAALQREREAKKALKEQLAQPRGLTETEQKQLDSARYIATQLQNRPDILEALSTGQPLTREQARTVERVEAAAPEPVETPAADYDDAELREVAELQGYYAADGTPDLKAAQKYLGILDRRAAKLADARVAPLIQREVNTASERQIAQVEQMAVEMGVEPSQVRPILQELAKANPKMMAESPEYGMMGVIVAEGIASMQAKAARRAAPAPVAPVTPTPAPITRAEPLLVERSVGPARQPALSSADRARMKQYGVAPKALERANELLTKSDGGTITFGED